MYKLLIADDEPLVSVALESMLPWEQYHISVCGTAINGRQALEMIRSLRPDLVITDSFKIPGRGLYYQTGNQAGRTGAFRKEGSEEYPGQESRTWKTQG